MRIEVKLPPIGGGEGVPEFVVTRVHKHRGDPQAIASFTFLQDCATQLIDIVKNGGLDGCSRRTDCPVTLLFVTLGAERSRPSFSSPIRRSP
jgi:hypothetical protein